jgi:hypothetical protein
MSAHSPGGPPPPPQPPYRTPPPRDALVPVASSLSTAALVLAVVGFLIGIVPFAGCIGTLGVILGVVDLVQQDAPGQPRKHANSVVAIVFGTLASAGVVFWIWVWSRPPSTPGVGSCPHVYAFDGAEHRLDADMVSGALFSGAERSDLDRLEHLRPVSGQYRVRIADELEETDSIDSLTLLVVDHAEGVEVLPTQAGELVTVRGAASPLRAVDAAGRDVLPLLATEDGRGVTGSLQGVRADGDDPREAWTLTFARPATDRAVLVVRGRSTAFAEQAFSAYLSTMGQGTGPLLRWALKKDCACTREYMDEEIARLGLPLVVSVSAGGVATPPVETATLAPIGPAVVRSQALPLALPPGEGPVTVRLEATPQFWEIDQVELAPASPDAVEPTVLRARSAVRSSGTDVTDLLREIDGRRVVLHQGETVDVRFDAPPPASGGARTVVASMRGFYDMNIGGREGLSVASVVAHRAGIASLPRFAASLAHE